MKKFILSALVISAAVLTSACGGSDGKTVKINEKNVHMNIDEKYTVKAECRKDDKIVWSSNDEKIAVVAPDGTVTAVGNGITTVTAKSEKSGYAHVGIIVGKDSEYVDEDGNVVPTFDEESDIESIIVGVKGGGKNDITLKKDEKHQLKAYTDPSDSTDKIVWKSDDKKVAKVNSKGEITAIGYGKTKITAYAPNGVNGELVVRVR